MNSKWILVRHGETDWNAEGKAQGQSDTPLNATGRKQAEETGAKLREMRFDAAYSSDLERVVHTAMPIVEGRDIPLTQIEGLREKKFGDWEGMTFQQVESEHPEMFRRLFDEDINFAPPSGESDLQLYERIKAVADKLLAAHQDDDTNILVVAHGGTLRALIVVLMDMPPQYMWRLRLRNCGISVVSVFDGGAFLEILNDTAHLHNVYATGVW